MMLGFLTSGQLGDLKTTMEWARVHGFQSISIALPPDSKFIDLSEILNNPRLLLDLEGESGICISAFGFYGNPLHPDASVRKIHTEHFVRLLEATYKLEKTVVTGWLGTHPGGIDESIEEAKKVWPPILKKAEDYGVKIAIENCPGNVMYRPDIWRIV
ncbi:MAG: TIM barrel protein, partial [Thermofilaceae archaeon]